MGTGASSRRTRSLRCARRSTGRRWPASTMSTAIAISSAAVLRWLPSLRDQPPESHVVTLTSINRWKASAIHLAISAAIGISVVVLMLALWYPQHYFAAMGGGTLIMLLIGVDVVIGPLITLIVFDPKKKNLRFDLAVIALLQLAALVY